MPQFIMNWGMSWVMAHPATIAMTLVGYIITAFGMSNTKKIVHNEPLSFALILIWNIYGLFMQRVGLISGFQPVKTISPTLPGPTQLADADKAMQVQK